MRESIIHETHKLNERETAIRDWTARFGRRPPKNLSTVFLARALAFEDQCQQTSALKQLSKRVQRELEGGFKAMTTGTGLAAGSHLVREWNGRTYQVEVLDNGFVMDGRTYRSLSAIASKITGTNWSGPRFFGLVKRRVPSSTSFGMTQSGAANP
ncbi:DUF2924 domain-containing protein [Roseibium polysiphoniae]|uniref:DUF2924 domain-containing protein n=1 Tax=Roseibium polysiphoniae TaxID=2571221 RepID=A0A944CGD4_9HYPH|nr:DUF2924 domain-containing protein [Roseibium polysiphoniae]MBS8262811.1 DUF2924 domain-containing protein [Roseibium polysiphoniae]